jgi:hypothetical protein
MALDSFASLKSSITNWMARSDLATIAEDCIALAEGDFNRLLRTRDMEDNETLTPDGNGEATLPTDYLAWRTVTVLTNPRVELEYVAPSFMEDQYGDRAAGQARYFTVRGTKITVVPLTSSTVRFDYYAKIPALSDANTTNWLLTKYPNTYLYQCLKHAAVFIRDDNAAGTYGALANASLQALEADDSGSRFARASARISGPTP